MEARVQAPRSRPGKYFDPVVLSRIKNLTLLARHVVEGLMAGLHRSSLHGLSVEFSEHRPYTPGDELKRIDWKLFARQDRYYVKEYEAETNMRAFIFLDASASMGYGGDGITKLEYGSYIAASLAHLMLLQRDSVGLVSMSREGLRILPAKSHPNHLRTIIAELEGLEAGGGTDICGSLEEVAATLRRRGLFVVISDFIDDPGALQKGFKNLQHRRHDIMAFHIAHREEIEFPFRKVTLFRDLEDGLEVTTDPRSIRSEYRSAVDSHLAKVKALCRVHSADYDLFYTDDPLHRGLVRYLARRGSS